jgi:hypothetical protein
VVNGIDVELFTACRRRAGEKSGCASPLKEGPAPTAKQTLKQFAQQCITFCEIFEVGVNFAHLALHLASYLNIKQTDVKLMRVRDDHRQRRHATATTQQAIKRNSLSYIDDHELIEDRELLDEVPILASIQAPIQPPSTRASVVAIESAFTDFKFVIFIQKYTLPVHLN